MKFSILIPAYNAENFIAESILSVMNQTYPNWEMIIVNDGSTDNTLDILREYETIDKRIKVINQENKGPLLAREAGIDISTGDYLMFLDADDYYELNTLELVNEEIKMNNPDLLLFGMKTVDTNRTLIKTIPYLYGTDSSNGEITREYLLNDFLGSNKLNNLVTKTVKKSILDKDVIEYNFYGKLIQAEDRLKSLPIIFNSNKIIYINKRFYNYRTNPNSTTHNFTIKNFRDKLTSESIMEKYLIDNNVEEQYFHSFYNSFIYHSLGSYLRLIGFQKRTKYEKKKALKLLSSSEIFKRAKPYLKGKNKYIYRLIKKERLMMIDMISFINKKRLGL